MIIFRSEWEMFERRPFSRGEDRFRQPQATSLATLEREKEPEPGLGEVFDFRFLSFSVFKGSHMKLFSNVVFTFFDILSSIYLYVHTIIYSYRIRTIILDKPAKLVKELVVTMRKMKLMKGFRMF